MSDNLVSDSPPGSSLLRIFAWLLFGTLLIASAIGSEIASAVYQVDLLDVFQDPASHPDASGIILMSQGISAALGLVVLPACYIIYFEKKSVARFFRNESKWVVVIIVIAASVIGLALSISPIIEWNAGLKFPESLFILEQMEKMAEEVTKAITDNLTPISFVFAFLVVAIIPAVGEELVFRGIIQTELLRAFRNPHAAVWTAAVLFSAIHFQFLGFIPRMLIGAFLGYLYVWSGNLWVPVLGHFFNNAIQLSGMYLYQQGAVSFDIESTESAPLPLVIAAVVLTGAALWYLRKYFRSASSMTNGPV